MTGLNLPQPPLHPYGGPSDGLARWSSVDLARLSPCGWKNGFRWPAAFPCGPLCGTECKFPRPAEWLPSSLPLLVEPASSRLSTGPLSNPRPVVFRQVRFELLHLAARRAHQILPAAFADGRQILLAHDTAIKHPDPARLAVLAFDHAQNRLHQQRHCWQQQSDHTIARYQFTGAPSEYFRHLVTTGRTVLGVRSSTPIQDDPDHR